VKIYSCSTVSRSITIFFGGDSLLRRERRMAAANEQMGIAQDAYDPTFGANNSHRNTRLEQNS